MPNEYNSNPNQRHIRVNKELCDTSADNYYAKINLRALQNAMHSLSPKAFELWVYFSKNVDKHSFYLSKVDFLNWSNIKATSYFNAFNELVEKNYLIPIDKGSSQPKNYNFYEIPREEQEELITITINKTNNIETTINEVQKPIEPIKLWRF